MPHAAKRSAVIQTSCILDRRHPLPEILTCAAKPSRLLKPFPLCSQSENPTLFLQHDTSFIERTTRDFDDVEGLKTGIDFAAPVDGVLQTRLKRVRAKPCLRSQAQHDDCSDDQTSHLPVRSLLATRIAIITIAEVYQLDGIRRDMIEVTNVDEDLLRAHNSYRPLGGRSCPGSTLVLLWMPRSCYSRLVFPRSLRCSTDLLTTFVRVDIDEVEMTSSSPIGHSEGSTLTAGGSSILSRLCGHGEVQQCATVWPCQAAWSDPRTLHGAPQALSGKTIVDICSESPLNQSLSTEILEKRAERLDPPLRAMNGLPCMACYLDILEAPRGRLHRALRPLSFSHDAATLDPPSRAA